MGYCETLSDHLFENGINKKKACILFGRSRQTLERWENNPPDWVIRIVKLMGKKPAFPDQWQEWYFYDEYICDEDGNKYHISEVRNIFWDRQFIRSLTGSTYDVYSLKTRLEERIKALDSEISITVHVGEKESNFKIAL